MCSSLGVMGGTCSKRAICAGGNATSTAARCCQACPPCPSLRRRALLEAVKQLKLQELEAAGVPKKYRAQLETMVPMAPQRGGK